MVSRLTSPARPNNSPNASGSASLRPIGMELRGRLGASPRRSFIENQDSRSAFHASTSDLPGRTHCGRRGFLQLLLGSQPVMDLAAPAFLEEEFVGTDRNLFVRDLSCPGRLGADRLGHQPWADPCARVSVPCSWHYTPFSQWRRAVVHTAGRSVASARSGPSRGTRRVDPAPLSRCPRVRAR
jgi:hypothetical protein